MNEFKLKAPYKPTGDQPQAIEKLVEGFKEGNQFETLLGVTGSGKTFTMANVIAQLNKPTLVLAHNKTLAAQLYGEMKEFFPENAVEYFVSYYDYYQPEAYVPSTDTYIAKDASTNDEIDKLRLSATAALCERKDVIVVSSVSCIYGLGAPQEFFDMMISLRPGMEKDRDEVIKQLIDIRLRIIDVFIQKCCCHSWILIFIGSHQKLFQCFYIPIHDPGYRVSQANVSFHIFDAIYRHSHLSVHLSQKAHAKIKLIYLFFDCKFHSFLPSYAPVFCVSVNT